MKNESLQQLMERYREGTLSESEVDELNRLCHRDEVMAAAEKRANGIVRRRRSIAFTVAGLLVAGVATWSLLPQRHDSTPLMAGTAVPEAAPLPEPVREVPVETAVPVTPTARPATSVRTAKRTAEAHHTNSVHSQPEATGTVVTCNNQCEADSVINDIWKFLTV